MDFKTKYSSSSNKKYLDTFSGYSNQNYTPRSTLRSKVKGLSVSKEDKLIEKLDMCQRKIDEYFLKSEWKNKQKQNIPLKLGDTFGKETLKQYSSMIIDDKQKQNNEQQQTLPTFNEYRLQPYMKTTQAKVPHQRRFSYNCGTNQAAIQTYTPPPTYHHVSKQSIDKLDQIPSKISNHFDLSHSTKSNISTQLDRKKLGNKTQRYQHRVPKFQNIETINNLNNKISERMNRMMKSFK